MGGNFYWSLGLSLIATAFGNSLQPIPVMSIVQPAAMLTAFQQMAGHRSIREKIFVAALLAVMHAILWTFAFGGLFKVEGWSTKGILIVFALGLLLWAVICGPVLLGFSSIAQHYPGPISSLFAFPCLWTAAYSVIGLTPLSTMANPAYALLDSRSLALAASMCGIHGLNFVLAHAGCIIHQRVSGKGLQQAKKTRGLTEISIGVLVALMVYGGAWGHVGTFYQRDIDQTAAKVDINVSCVLAPGKAMSPIPDSSEEWLFQQTAERVAAGDDIVLWSEAAVLVRDHNAAQGLLGRAAALQLSSNASSAPYLGITYWQDLGQKNMFVLLEPSGKVAWSYQKAHPVPFQMDGKPGVLPPQRLARLLCIPCLRPGALKPSIH